jgi:uncharacterized protein YndB with AHSA1/START domain
MLPANTTTEMDHIRIEADFPHTSPEALFDYFTRADLLTQWWPTEAEINNEPGGEFVLRWPAMNWTLRGAYTLFEPGHRLMFTWAWDHEPSTPTRTVDVVFEHIASGTHLVLKHGTYMQEDAEERQGHIDGWLHFLGRLQEITEKINKPHP